MKRTWWKEAVVYQIYWRSFYDTNGDGYGDLQGVLAKLDYIQSLGVDVLWLNPFYESPDRDNGYDIADYYSIMAKAGDLADFQRLLDAVHARGMKLIMDLVVNHTSDQHPWFREARAAKDSPKRDYYIWRDGRADGQPPSNWRSYFTPSTWEYDATTDQYYFHSFAIEQPDLNWENQALREEIYKMMRFWLDMGIDGFRLDAIALLAKQPGFPDSEHPEHFSYLTNNPGLHDYLQEMHEQVFAHYDILTVGEVAFATPEEGLLYVGEDRGELHTLFHFEVADDMATWDMLRFKDIQQRWYDGLWGKGWNSQFLNNHDHTRQVTRYGNDREFRVESAKLLATLVHTLPGHPYIYQGEEIGMTGVRFPSIEDYDDIAMKEKYKEELAKGRDPQEVFESLLARSRDNSRTPMQWDDSDQAGFTTGTPWIKINPNYPVINVQAALDDPNSVFYYYQKLIALRKCHPVLTYGSWQDLSPGHEQLYLYTRELEGERLLILLNHSDQPNTITLPDEYLTAAQELLLANYSDVTGAEPLAAATLRPHEARIYRISHQ